MYKSMINEGILMKNSTVFIRLIFRFYDYILKTKQDKIIVTAVKPETQVINTSDSFCKLLTLKGFAFYLAAKISL